MVKDVDGSSNKISCRGGSLKSDNSSMIQHPLIDFTLIQ